MGLLPTPIQEWRLPGLPPGMRLLAKRDDLSGMQLSGNKVRKLEFLLAEALAGGYDCVVTAGGIQSNHARATAVAARYLGLDCHLILRTSRAALGEGPPAGGGNAAAQDPSPAPTPSTSASPLPDPGLVGNLLVERLAGAQLHLVTKEEYGALGGQALLAQLEAQLVAQGRRPYVIPVGGSNALGTWGYIEAVDEIVQQAAHLGVTDIAMACGSGGTTAGLALGSHLSPLKARVHAYGVCDTPDYFYDFIDGLLAGLGATSEALGGGEQGGGSGGEGARALVRCVQARGAGYAISREEELATVQAVAAATGVVLDPVYGGKALHGLLREAAAAPEQWAARTVLFVHTGGLLGMYDKLDQLGPLVAARGAPVRRMAVQLPQQ